MSQALTTVDTDVSPAVLARRQRDYQRIKQYIEDGLSENTKRSYESHLKQFAAFCADRDWPSLPASSGAVVAYLTAAVESGMAVTSARVARSVIGVTHERAGHPNPSKGKLVDDVMKSLARKHGRPPRRAQAMTSTHVTAATEHIGTDLPGLRDRAIILVGYGAAMRRSEIVALDVEDFETLPDGRARVTVRRSKTDQEGKGATAILPRAATDAVRAWWQAAGITSGPAFVRMTRTGPGKTRLSAQYVRTIVRTRAGHAGLDPDGRVKWSGHSLRRGAATEAAEHGANQRQLMILGRWSSASGVEPYIDRREIDDPDALLGL